ncbi:EpsG family protein [Providencia alcalifaciens]|uniref:EpsG family protein n=1 Tax=Providencia alcalifaciens TaxID=126385 RepID=UPI0003E27B6B|nr:EpsG family protein [Providencia alcalifaciens PAL-3]EUC98979.1 EpsG family protein [Providencia alcalifaciens PAL-1]
MKSILSFWLRLIISSPLILFLYFPFEYNLDYENYYPNYIYGYFTYDFLYEWLSFILREIFHLEFNIFWVTLLSSQLILFSLIYNRISILLIAYPSLITMSQFFYGTQIRYSIAALVLVYATVIVKNNFYRLLLYISCSLFHYGIVIPLCLSIISKKIHSDFYNIRKLRSICLALLIVLLFSFTLYFIEWFVSATRFSYYIGSNHYMTSKSPLSIVYISMMLILLLLTFTFNIETNTNLLTFGISLLFTCLLTSTIAVLSGRLLLIYFILEPLIIYYTIKNNKYHLISISIIILYLFRLLFYSYNANFYFFEII